MKDKSDHRRPPRARPRHKSHRQKIERRRIRSRGKIQILEMIIERFSRR